QRADLKYGLGRMRTVVSGHIKRKHMPGLVAVSRDEEGRGLGGIPDNPVGIQKVQKSWLEGFGTWRGRL
ncbi:MAG TPA: hypothetical protein VGE93_07905, partial [Bryobacteraceae bacterium]